MERLEVRRRDEPILLKEAAFPGILSGLLAAAIMAVVWMLFASRGGDLWRPMKLIAATVLGESAIHSSGFQPIPVLLGIALHLLMGILMGVFFTWLGGYLTVGAATSWGLIFGLAIWVIMQFGILPVINPWMAEFPPIPFAISHALFGLSLGSYPIFLPEQERRVPQILRKAA